MSFVTTTDGVEIFYKDWGADNPLSSIMAGRSVPTIGMPRCCSSLVRDTA